MTRLFGAGVLCLAALVCAGCSSGKGEISGKVAYNATPILNGTVTFIAQDGLAYSTPIKEDGTYRIERVPVGEAKILVDSPHPNAQSGGRLKGVLGARKGLPVQDPGIDNKATAVDPKKWVAIPMDYQLIEKTPLTYNVVSGRNQHDINMKPR